MNLETATSLPCFILPPLLAALVQYTRATLDVCVRQYVSFRLLCQDRGPFLASESGCGKGKGEGGGGVRRTSELIGFSSIAKRKEGRGDGGSSERMGGQELGTVWQVVVVVVLTQTWARGGVRGGMPIG